MVGIRQPRSKIKIREDASSINDGGKPDIVSDFSPWGKLCLYVFSIILSGMNKSKKRRSGI